jgi:hypothetical protein
MPEPTNDKTEDKKQPDIKNSKEYRKFRTLLKKVIKAPPMLRPSTLQQ